MASLNEFKNFTHPKKVTTRRSRAMKSTILEDFKIYQSLIAELRALVFQYRQAFKQLENQVYKESILNERISNQDKKRVERRIFLLQERINGMLPEIEDHIQKMKNHLENEYIALTESEVEEINRKHISTMTLYINCVIELEDLKKNYKDWDFSCVSFYKVDAEKAKLNSAIQQYNNTNLRLMDYKVYEVSEALKAARDEISNVCSRVINEELSKKLF